MAHANPQRFFSRAQRGLVAVALGLLVAGCGGASHVTYVDPNPDAAYAGIGGGADSQPIITYGVDQLDRAQAVIELRGAVATARTLADADPDAARSVLEAAQETALPVIEGRLAATDPALAKQLAAALGQLQRGPSADQDAYGALLQRTAGPLLDRVASAVVSSDARQDEGFRAAVLAESLREAGMQYESAFAGSPDSIDVTRAYRIAYGLLLDARTRGLDAVPAPERRAIQAQLTRVANSATPGPTPPDDPAGADSVLSKLDSVAQLVSAAAGIDTQWPTPEASTPDELRALKRGLAVAVGTAERGDIPRANAQLATARDALATRAARGLAAVDPELLASIERGLAVTLPAAIDGRDDVAGAAAEIDTQIDQAITTVETELDQLRDSE